MKTRSWYQSFQTDVSISKVIVRHKKKIIIDSKWIHIVVHIDFTHCCVSLHEEGSNKFCDEITRDSLSNKRLKYLYPYFIYGGQTSELKKCNVQSLCPFIRC